jgi:hypothetical protein
VRPRPTEPRAGDRGRFGEQDGLPDSSCAGEKHWPRHTSIDCGDLNRVDQIFEHLLTARELGGDLIEAGAVWVLEARQKEAD